MVGNFLAVANTTEGQEMSETRLTPAGNHPANPEPGKEDLLDRWQYRIFKVVLFIIALYAMWEFLNEHVPVKETFKRIVGW
jgi:hypothetical protein